MLQHDITRPIWLAASLLCAAQFATAAEADAFMGDWQGTLVKPKGGRTPLVAQVIALGKGTYRANLLEQFDTRSPAVAVLDGTLTEGKVVFGDMSTIDGTAFAGKLTGDHKLQGEFEMARVSRLSPAIGAKPPETALVLFDGTNMDEWLQAASPPGMVNFSKLLGGSNRAVYLRNRVWAPEQRDVRLELGSDDGVKVWLNERVVHANNRPRPCRPGEDKVDITLEQGWNTLLVKVVQGGGGWAFCGRLIGRDGALTEGLRTEHAPAADDGRRLDELNADNKGFIIAWQLAGPFTKDGLNGQQLFDVDFPSETAPDSVKWQPVNPKAPAGGYRWRLVADGAMQVTPKSGSLVSKRTFKDHRIHLEFRTPFMPAARGQGRGNSGVYIQGRYEVQVLDSYGLEGKDNECGGVYKIAAPRVNMCAPPLEWQTYDITFHAPTFDADGKMTANARVTVIHNGVVIHADLKLPGATGGKRGANQNKPGPVLLQDHGNAVQYRNIWVEEL